MTDREYQLTVIDTYFREMEKTLDGNPAIFEMRSTVDVGDLRGDSILDKIPKRKYQREIRTDGSLLRMWRDA